jgi:hypothetical protein
MNDRIRAASDDLLTLHKETSAFVAQQQDLFKKSMLFGFEIGRASFDASVDLQQKMVRNWTDAMLSAAEKATPAKA